MGKREQEQMFEKRMQSMDSWRVFRIVSEFVDGFETMTDLGPSVSVFGSARFRKDSPYHKLAVDLGYKLAKEGFAVITGGGPGTMEAANRGAQEAKGHSCGLSVDLPYEEKPNEYIDPQYNLSFRYFFVRKVMFIRYAQGCVFLPGGYGTMDELFEALTLTQTGKVHSFPIYLLGKKYWSGLFEWIKSTVLENGCINPEDIDRVIITDDLDEVAKGIKEHYKKQRVFKNF